MGNTIEDGVKSGYLPIVAVSQCDSRRNNASQNDPRSPSNCNHRWRKQRRSPRLVHVFWRSAGIDVFPSNQAFGKMLEQMILRGLQDMQTSDESSWLSVPGAIVFFLNNSPTAKLPGCAMLTQPADSTDATVRTAYLLAIRHAIVVR